MLLGVCHLDCKLAPVLVYGILTSWQVLEGIADMCIHFALATVAVETSVDVFTLRGLPGAPCMGWNSIENTAAVSLVPDVGSNYPNLRNKSCVGIPAPERGKMHRAGMGWKCNSSD
jgi:hypothetical protein